MKKVLRAIVMFLLPAGACRVLFRLFGVKDIEIGKGCKIGFSYIAADQIKMEAGARIGHLNYVNIKLLEMGGGCKIRHLNIIKGSFRLIMQGRAWMNSQNKISSGPMSIKKPVTQLLMINSALIMKHNLDLSDNITIHDNTTLAGVGSQIWTHAFYKSPTRSAKVTGPVEIGRNCYIGSNVIICAGVTIGDNIAIGANATVSKDLTEQGLYVNQPLRFIEFDADKKIDALGERPVSGAFRKSKKE